MVTYKGMRQGFQSLQHSEAAAECPDQSVVELLFEGTLTTCLKLVCLGNRAVGGVIGVLFNPKGMSLGLKIVPPLGIHPLRRDAAR